MSEFLLESHAHTAEVSTCAHLYADEIVDFYVDEGYHGIVITDHLKSDFFERNKHLDHKDAIDAYLLGYRKVRDYAGDKLKVFLGLEVSLDNSPNDYLVFGVEEDFLYKNKDFHKLKIKEFSKLVRQNGFLLVQAHPFRKGMRIVDPFLLDGIEVYNGNSSHNSSNAVAEAWAERFDLIGTSGSDFHYFFRTKPGGMIFDKELKTNAELVEALRAREYRLKK